MLHRCVVLCCVVLCCVVLCCVVLCCTRASALPRSNQAGCAPGMSCGLIPPPGTGEVAPAGCVWKSAGSRVCHI